MTQILVIGASKGIGRAVAKQASAAGYAVRALSRGSGHSAEPGLEWFSADARDPDALARALEDVDVVVQTLGVPTGPELLCKPVTLFSEATSALLPAMRASDVRRLISVTGYGAGDSRASISCLPGLAFELILGRAYADKDVQETLIRESDRDWTIVRPVILTNGPRLGRYKVLDDPGRWRNGLISRRDVADFIVRQLEDDIYIRKAPVVRY